jgi:Ca2+-binding RTX toxin-like protein
MGMKNTVLLLASVAAALLLASGVALIAPKERARAAFPGINGSIVYADATKLYTVPPTGGTPEEVPEAASSPTSGVWHASPEFSADGKTIIYSASDGNDREIFVLPTTGGTATRLTDNTTDDLDPTISPDGKTFAYSALGDIFVANTDGSGAPTNLTNTRCCDDPDSAPIEREFDPAFSPDGKTIAYAQYWLHQDGYIYYLYTIPAIGGTPTTVPSGAPTLQYCCSNFRSLDFSPDGTKLVYSGGDAHYETGWNIVVASLTGEESIALTNYDESDPIAEPEAANFSPDGSKVAYYIQSWDANQPSGIYTVPATGGEPTYVSKGGPDFDWGVSPASADDCTIQGTVGNDVLEGTPGGEVICGLGGNDTIKGLGGNDTLKGGDGNDKLLGGQGNDTIDGGSGVTDTASFGPAAAAIKASLTTNASTGEGSDTLVAVENLEGTNYTDELTGSNAANRLLGLSGTDTISGSGGPDTLQGGANSDTLTGGAGADKHLGEKGSDTLKSKDGVSGNDAVDGGAGTDKCLTDAKEKSIVSCP